MTRADRKVHANPAVLRCCGNLSQTRKTTSTDHMVTCLSCLRAMAAGAHRDAVRAEAQLHDHLDRYNRYRGYLRFHAKEVTI